MYNSKICRALFNVKLEKIMISSDCHTYMHSTNAMFLVDRQIQLHLKISGSLPAVMRMLQKVGGVTIFTAQTIISSRIAVSPIDGSNIMIHSLSSTSFSESKSDAFQGHVGSFGAVEIRLGSAPDVVAPMRCESEVGANEFRG